MKMDTSDHVRHRTMWNLRSIFYFYLVKWSSDSWLDGPEIYNDKVDQIFRVGGLKDLQKLCKCRTDPPDTGLLGLGIPATKSTEGSPDPWGPHPVRIGCSVRRVCSGGFVWRRLEKQEHSGVHSQVQVQEDLVKTLEELAKAKEQVNCLSVRLYFCVGMFTNVESCSCVCVFVREREREKERERERVMFDNSWIAQNDKLQKEIDVQNKEIKDLCVLNVDLKEHLANLLKDIDPQIKSVRKVGRD